MGNKVINSTADYCNHSDYPLYSIPTTIYILTIWLAGRQKYRLEKGKIMKNLKSNIETLELIRENTDKAPNNITRGGVAIGAITEGINALNRLSELNNKIDIVICDKYFEKQYYAYCKTVTLDNLLAEIKSVHHSYVLIARNKAEAEKEASAINEMYKKKGLLYNPKDELNGLLEKLAGK